MNSRRTAILAVSGAAAVLLTAGLVAQAVGGADPTSSPSPSVSSTDDNGGELDRDLRFEPGDDRDVNGNGTAGAGAYDDYDDDDDDSGQGHGRGHGDDDHGDDDHGSGGHGSDDD